MQFTLPFLLSCIFYCFTSQASDTKYANTLSAVESKHNKNSVPTEEDIIVFEGTVLLADRKYYKRTIVTSCVVEVNTVFAGELDEKEVEVFVFGGSMRNFSFEISHGQLYLLGKHVTAIFRVRKMNTDHYLFDLNSVTPFALYEEILPVVEVFPRHKHSTNTPHIEYDLYQKYENRSGEKRQEIILPETYNPIAIDHSMNHGLLVPNRMRGLVYNISLLKNYKREKQIGYNICIASSNAVSYFSKGELLVQYSTKAFGDSAISRGTISAEIQGKYSNWQAKYRRDKLNSLSMSLHDVDSNTFRIEWATAHETDALLQIFPDIEGISIATVYCTPLDTLAPIDMTIRSKTSQNLEYRFSENDFAPYEYTATNQLPNLSVKEILTPRKK